MSASAGDRELVRRIRLGEEQAWQQLIHAYEGRLLAFAVSRIRDRSLSEDLVQETFVGFLTALPNFDDNTPIESFLFAITANKITDALRKLGRRPTLPLNADDADASVPEPAARGRMASSLARSREQRQHEERLLADCLRSVIAQCRDRGDYERIKCVELLFVRGVSNKTAADTLGVTEQAVANHKFFVVSKLKDAARDAGTSVDFRSLGISD